MTILKEYWNVYSGTMSTKGHILVNGRARRAHTPPFPWLCALAGCLLVGAACRAQQQPPAHEHWPTATIKDVMVSIVDPSADALWESVAEIVTFDGVERREPEFDEEWAALRAHAIRLLEAPNLLTVEGRQVAPEADASAHPGIELEPAEIAALIDKDQPAWTRLAKELHDSAQPALAAIDAKNPQGLMDAGERIYHACESCHQKYWYPNSPQPPTDIRP